MSKFIHVAAVNRDTGRSVNALTDSMDTAARLLDEVNDTGPGAATSSTDGSEGAS